MLNAALAGKRYPARRFEVTADAIHAYAAATNESNPVFLGPSPLAPPAFPIVVAGPILDAAMNDGDLGVNLARLVHAEQEHLFHRPILAGDVLSAEGTLEAVEPGEAGERFTVGTLLTGPGGEPVAELKSVMFIRGRGGRRAGAEEPTEPPAVFETTESVDGDQAVRYAEASGDHNPIHLDREFARSAGFPGVILHGMCTMAFASRAVLDGACSSDPRRLRSIRVSFSRPVMPGQSLTTHGWPLGGGDGFDRYGFVTVLPSGSPVIRDGLARVVPVQ